MNDRSDHPTHTDRAAANQPARKPDDAVIAAVRARLESSGLIGDGLLNWLKTDDNARVFDPRVDLGPAALDGENAAQAHRRIQFALRKEPSGRWIPLLRRRTARLKLAAAQALTEWFDALRNTPDLCAAAYVAELIRQLDAEIAALRREASRIGEALGQVNRQLQPLQAEIEKALTPGGSSWISRLLDLSAVMTTLGRGVSLMARVVTAERLVNDREEYAFSADLITAAIGVAQEAREAARAELDRLAQLRVNLLAAQQLLAEARAQVNSRLGTHPYAQVDATHPQQVARIGARIAAALSSNDLTTFLPMDPAQLFTTLQGAALEQTQRVTASLDLVQLMEDEAKALADNPGEAAGRLPDIIPDELVLDALQATYRHAVSPSLKVSPDAQDYELSLVGVTDETAPGFNFERATLVSTGRRDRVQFLHVRVGLCLLDLIGFEQMTGRLESASQRRNYYVLEALAQEGGGASGSQNGVGAEMWPAAEHEAGELVGENNRSARP